MNKVASHRKFSRVTSTTPLRQYHLNNQKINSRNRSFIQKNQQPQHQYLEFLEPFEPFQENQNATRTINDQSRYPLNRNLSIQFQTKSAQIQNNFKTQQKLISFDSKTQIFNQKITKIESINSSRIKIEDNDKKSSQKILKRSSSIVHQSLRSSALKKSPKFQVPFSRNSKMTKASIFHHQSNSQNIQMAHVSEQYEQFLREPKLDNFCKKVICEQPIENDSDKQNQELKDKKLRFRQQDKVSQKSIKKMKIEENDQGGSSTKSMKRVSTKTAKQTQKLIKLPNQQRLSTKKIFRSATQQNLRQTDNQSDKKSLFRIQNASTVFNQREVALRKQQDLKRAEQNRIERQILYKEQAEELYRLLQLEIASKQEMERFEKKSNNYYEELRQKLLQEYERIWKDYRMDEKERDNIGMLIEGCNLERHRRVNNFYFEKKQSGGGGRIEAAAIGQATKDINKLNFINKDRKKTIVRPYTSRPKSSSKVKHKNSYDKNSNMTSDCVMSSVGMQTERQFHSKYNRTFNKLSDPDTECIFNMTSPDIKSRINLQVSSTERPQTAKSRENKALRMKENLGKQQFLKQRAKFANKFDVLMDICDEENDGQDETKKKLKVFGYYCGKINNGFEKLSQKITDYVANL